EDRDRRDAVALEALQQVEAAAIAAAEIELGQIADMFGIGLLAEHDNRDVGARCEIAVRTQGRGAAGGFDRGLEAGPDRDALREVGVVAAAPLPGDGPAAALQA